MTEVKWPEGLYATPPSWGQGTYLLAEEEALAVVRFLQKLGEGMWNPSLDDAMKVTFMCEIEPGFAVYEGAGRRVVVTPRGDPSGGRYNLVKLVKPV